MSYVQPSMFGEYEDHEFSSSPNPDFVVRIKPGWRVVSTKRRNLGWHKIKLRTTLGVITACGRIGFTTIPALDPEYMIPCPECWEKEQLPNVG